MARPPRLPNPDAAAIRAARAGVDAAASAVPRAAANAGTGGLRLEDFADLPLSSGGTNLAPLPLGELLDLGQGRLAGGGLDVVGGSTVEGATEAARRSLEGQMFGDEMPEWLNRLDDALRNSDVDYRPGVRVLQYDAEGRPIYVDPATGNEIPNEINYPFTLSEEGEQLTNRTVRSTADVPKKTLSPSADTATLPGVVQQDPARILAEIARHEDPEVLQLFSKRWKTYPPELKQSLVLKLSELHPAPWGVPGLSTRAREIVNSLESGKRVFHEDLDFDKIHLDAAKDDPYANVSPELLEKNGILGSAVEIPGPDPNAPRAAEVAADDATMAGAAKEADFIDRENPHSTLYDRVRQTAAALPQDSRPVIPAPTRMSKQELAENMVLPEIRDQADTRPDLDVPAQNVIDPDAPGVDLYDRIRRQGPQETLADHARSAEERGGIGLDSHIGGRQTVLARKAKEIEDKIQRVLDEGGDFRVRRSDFYGKNEYGTVAEIYPKALEDLNSPDPAVRRRAAENLAWQAEAPQDRITKGRDESRNSSGMQKMKDRAIENANKPELQRFNEALKRWWHKVNGEGSFSADAVADGGAVQFSAGGLKEAHELHEIISMIQTGRGTKDLIAKNLAESPDALADQIMHIARYIPVEGVSPERFRDQLVQSLSKPEVWDPSGGKYVGPAEAGAESVAESAGGLDEFAPTSKTSDKPTDAPAPEATGNLDDFAAAPEAAPASSGGLSEFAPVPEGGINLRDPKKMKVAELREAIQKEIGVEPTKGAKKADLLQMLVDHRAGGSKKADVPTDDSAKAAKLKELQDKSIEQIRKRTAPDGSRPNAELYDKFTDLKNKRADGTPEQPTGDLNDYSPTRKELEEKLEDAIMEGDGEKEMAIRQEMDKLTVQRSRQPQPEKTLQDFVPTPEQEAVNKAAAQKRSEGRKARAEAKASKAPEPRNLSDFADIPEEGINLRDPKKMKVAELREAIQSEIGVEPTKGAKKADLLKMLEDHRAGKAADADSAVIKEKTGVETTPGADPENIRKMREDAEAAEAAEAATSTKSTKEQMDALLDRDSIRYIEEMDEDQLASALVDAYRLAPEEVAKMKAEPDGVNRMRAAMWEAYARKKSQKPPEQSAAPPEPAKTSEGGEMIVAPPPPKPKGPGDISTERLHFPNEIEDGVPLWRDRNSDAVDADFEMKRDPTRMERALEWAKNNKLKTAGGVVAAIIAGMTTKNALTPGKSDPFKPGGPTPPAPGGDSADSGSTDLTPAGEGSSRGSRYAYESKPYPPGLFDRVHDGGVHPGDNPGTRPVFNPDQGSAVLDRIYQERSGYKTFSGDEPAPRRNLTRTLQRAVFER